MQLARAKQILDGHKQSWLDKAYFYVFARPSMQDRNDRMLQRALSARGYDNFENKERTGERFFIDFLSRYDPQLCVDIGANVGSYSQLLLTGTRSKVISFEPLPKAYASLAKLRERYPGRFEPINKGIGNRCGQLELHYGEEDSPFASFSIEVNAIDYVRTANVNTICADVVTLDEYFSNEAPGQIDLIKIDTEGYEYEVLSGAKRTISESKPKFVQVEFNWHHMFRKTPFYLLSELLAGYRAYQLLPFGLSPRSPKDPLTNIYQFSNFVFVRPDIRW